MPPLCLLLTNVHLSDKVHLSCPLLCLQPCVYKVDCLVSNLGHKLSLHFNFLLSWVLRILASRFEARVPDVDGSEVILLCLSSLTMLFKQFPQCCSSVIDTILPFVQRLTIQLESDQNTEAMYICSSHVHTKH